MALKFIEVPHSSLKAAFRTLDTLGLTPGTDAIVELDGTVKVFLGAIDSLIETYIQASSKAEKAIPDPPPAQPDRQDRRVPMPGWARIKLMNGQRHYIGEILAADEDPQDIAQATANWTDYRYRLRLSILRPIVQGDVIPGSTVVYTHPTYSIEGATTLLYPAGEAIRCDRLIHMSHPVNPEDLYLREARTQCKSIYRYRVPGLDDAEWARQNDDRQDITPESYRELLLLRLNS